ncbi:SGNH/GDSL hydrolase family protein [Pedobacter sp. PWIIR3]
MKKSIVKFVLLFLICAVLTSFKRKEIIWVAIGDSITYLNDHRNETGERVAKGYLTRTKELMPDLVYYNQGHNGWTSVGIAKEFDRLGVQKGDVYSIFLGTNDWWSGIPLGTMDHYKNDSGTGTVYGAFRVIVNKIKTINPQTKIILITPMQRSDFVYLTDKNNTAWGSYKDKNGQSLASFADAVIDIAKTEGFGIVDLYHKKGLAVKDLVLFKRLKEPGTGQYRDYSYPEFISIPFNAADEYPYPVEAMAMTYDGLHPSDKGNELISKMLVKVLKKTLR